MEETCTIFLGGGGQMIISGLFRGVMIPMTLQSTGLVPFGFELLIGDKRRMDFDPLLRLVMHSFEF